MIKLPKYLLKLLLIFCFANLLSCNNERPNLLSGKWKATRLTENDKVLNVNLDEITFSFTDDNLYVYTSTLNYREAGSYYLKSNYLYTTDTLNQASTEKVVELIQITADSMQIRMEETGQERLLTLIKEKETTE